MSVKETQQPDALTAIHWARGLGSGLLAGAAFVAIAMLFEKEVMRAGRAIID